MSHVMNTYSRLPVSFTHGESVWVWDDKGRRYLDGFAGIVTVSVGHCHPDVVAAANRQSETLQHTTTIYLHPNIAEYARDLAQKMPGESVKFSVSGIDEAQRLLLSQEWTFAA